jgi:diadenosine tetraphosphate (Ap4A) HIT family hydrolase
METRDMTYDPSNIFAKILRGEIPNTTVFEDDHVLCFDDLYPQMPVHCLIIPKGQYTDLSDFSANATAEELTAFHRAIVKTVEIKGLSNGYRAICNTDMDGGQEVPHFHMHILGGEKCPPMIVKE